ncbi:glycine/D-amino acid oxidase, deaminating [Xylariales sp. PMI_506]|nr:glycine/D-amino acid oxidase, deaminating [Xylariales sp. PMI_506]
MGSRVESKPSVIVIGAGVVGASIAWHLARQNASVTIVAPEIGGTATPCSFAWLNASWLNAKFYYDFRRRSMARWKELADEVPRLREVVQWCGNLQWDLPEDELAKYEREHGAWGYDIGRVEREEIAAREPCLSSDVLPEWGLRLGEEGAVEATDAAKLMVADAQTHGARVVYGTVTNLIRNGDRVRGVATSSDGQLYADHVVLAAGVGSTQLCATVDVALPVTGRSGLLVHSKPISKRVLTGLVVSSGPHMRQTADGRLLAGSGFAGGDPGDDAQKTAEELFEKVRGMFKPDSIGSDQLELEYFTIGERPTPQDGLPILGPSGREGLTLAVMHSGVTLAAIVGQLLANEIVHGKKDAALEAFALSRFNPKISEE